MSKGDGDFSEKAFDFTYSKFFDKNQSIYMTNVISLSSQNLFICGS